MSVVSLDELADLVSHQDHPGARVIAIDGPSGSGKSTLAARLLARLPGASLVPLDDFLSWGDPQGRRWWARFQREVLVPALAGEAIRYRVRDWTGDEFGEGLAGWRDLPASRLVLIEGVGCARAAVRERGVFTIWVEAGRDRRLERGVIRDGESHRELWRAWMFAEDDFFARDRTRAEAHLRVDGDSRVKHDPTTHVVLVDWCHAAAEEDPGTAGRSNR